MTKTPLATLLLLSAAMASPLVGQGDDEHARRTLSGWKDVSVVMDISDEAARHGLTEDQIRTDLELKLRQAGISVVTQQAALADPEAPYLYLYVHVLRNELGVYAYSARLSVHQLVRLVRKPSVPSMAMTLVNAGGVGCGGGRERRFGSGPRARPDRPVHQRVPGRESQAVAATSTYLKEQ